MRLPVCSCACFLGLTAILLAAPPDDDHADLSWYRVSSGEKEPIKTLSDWQTRRREIITQMVRVFGPVPDRSSWPDPDLRILETTRLPDGVRRQKLEYCTDSSKQRVRAWLLIPATQATTPAAEEPDRRHAAVLCLHQTTSIGKDEPVGLGGNPNLHYALELVRRGFVTLSPDYPSFGEYPYTFPPEDGYVSGSMKAVADNMRAIDILQTLPDVDPDRIGCIGHSLGGHNTMFTAVFEPRIKVIVTSCSFTRFHKDSFPDENGLGSWTGPSYMPRIATVFMNDPDQVPFDFPEIIAAFAPRPFMTCSAIHDNDFDVTGVRESLAAARPIYSLYGATEQLRGEYPDSPHDFPPAAREAAYRFLEAHLNSPQ